MKNIAVIPARGGSKRIPRKNVKPFCGKPMIAWSIEAAKASGCFDRIVVSTDDDEIAETALQWGAEVPFRRPAQLSDDYVGTIPVMRHAVEWLTAGGVSVNYACCLYATAPFVRTHDLLQGLELMQKHETSYAVSVASFSFPIQRAVRIKANGRLEMFYPKHYKSRSQDLEEAWHDAGQFYWGTAEAWVEERFLHGEGSVGVPLPRYRVQDIDTQEDWDRAEWLFRAMRGRAVDIDE